MRIIPTFLFLFISAASICQTSSLDELKGKLIDLHDVWDTNYVSYPELKSILKDAEIVMLGEQSHFDGTSFATKVKLIEFLHHEMDFEILAFESGFYDCQKAWEAIENGARIDSTLALSIFGLWSETKSFIPLVNYIGESLKTNNPLQIAGFDSQFTGKRSSTDFIKDLKTYLASGDRDLFQTEDWKHFENTLGFVVNHNFKAMKKNDSERDLTYLSTLIKRIQDYPETKERSFWIRNMHNVEANISDSSKDRDFEMAENLFWLKEHNPDKKIICWGATSHFLYNSELIEFSDEKVRKAVGDYYKETPSMGNYVKDKYGEKVYTIGFTAFEGRYYPGGHNEIEPALDNSVEALLGGTDYDNSFLPLAELTLAPLISRPLGYQYMDTDISKVMDGVIFNRKMVASQGNYDLIYELHPEYKWSKKRKKKLEKEARKAAKAEVGD